MSHKQADTAASIKSNSDHSKKLQIYQEKIAPANKNEEILAKTKQMSQKSGMEKQTFPDLIDKISDESHESTVKLPVHYGTELPTKPGELRDDLNTLDATDDDVSDSIIQLESDYTETDVDSDSFASIKKFKTIKTEAPKNNEEKV